MSGYKINLQIAISLSMQKKNEINYSPTFKNNRN